MDSHQITEIIIENLTFPKHHEPRVKLQVWFELMNTFRKYGDPRVKHYDEDDIRDIAIRCVDLLVGDFIIKDCTFKPRGQYDKRKQPICRHQRYP